jgi:putative flippase GtrA
MRLPWQSLRNNMFLCFSCVGIVGFLVDSGVLLLLMRVAGMDPYTGRVFSFFCAASTTWLLNRGITFKGAGDSSESSRQWAVYLVLMLAGGVVNYSAYALCVGSIPSVRAHPVLGVAVGSLSGLVCNFFTSRSLFLGRLSGLLERAGPTGKH